MCALFFKYYWQHMMFYPDLVVKRVILVKRFDSAIDCKIPKSKWLIDTEKMMYYKFNFILVATPLINN